MRAQRRVRLIEGPHCAGNSFGTINQEEGWHDRPWQVKPDVIHPEVDEFGTAMRPAREVELALARRVIQGHAVEMRDARDDPQCMARGAIPCGRDRVGETEGTPEELSTDRCFVS